MALRIALAISRPSWRCGAVRAGRWPPSSTATNAALLFRKNSSSRHARSRHVRIGLGDYDVSLNGGG